MSVDCDWWPTSASKIWPIIGGKIIPSSAHVCVHASIHEPHQHAGHFGFLFLFYFLKSDCEMLGPILVPTYPYQSLPLSNLLTLSGNGRPVLTHVSGRGKEGLPTPLCRRRRLRGPSLLQHPQHLSLSFPRKRKRLVC